MCVHILPSSVEEAHQAMSTGWSGCSQLIDDRGERLDNHFLPL